MSTLSRRHRRRTVSLGRCPTRYQARSGRATDCHVHRRDIRMFVLDFASLLRMCQKVHLPFVSAS